MCLFVAVCIWLDVSDSWWTFRLSVLFLAVNAIAIASCLNRDASRKLAASFQTFVVSYNTAFWFATFSILWRNHPIKIATTAAVIPSFTLAGFLDAYPEHGRVVLCRVYFTLCLISIGIFQLIFLFHISALDDVTITVLDKWSFNLSSVTIGSISNLFLFMVKNLASNVMCPGALAVICSNVSSVKLDPNVVRALQTGHRLVFDTCDLSSGKIHFFAGSKAEKDQSLTAPWRKQIDNFVSVCP